MGYKTRILILIITLFCSFSSYSSENIFYVLRSNQPEKILTMQNSIASLEKHSKDVSIIISQAYQIDNHGVVWGYVDSDILKLAKDHSIKLMPLVTNVGFDKDITHEFLSNPAAVDRAIKTLVKACQDNQFYGVQLDFEMVALTDRNALTQFYEKTAQALHQNKLLVSFAVAPLISDTVLPSNFQKKLYENWEGAYDIKALGSSADFITIMAYNQHAGNSILPGPTAGYRWVEAVIQYALTLVPAEKISLGIPVFSSYWHVDHAAGKPLEKIKAQYAEIDFNQASYLLKKKDAHLQWDDSDKVNYTFYQYHWLNEYLFLEDAKSFQSKLDLIKKYHLRGFSVFHIGLEDPKIWDYLTKAN